MLGTRGAWRTAADGHLADRHTAHPFMHDRMYSPRSLSGSPKARAMSSQTRQSIRSQDIIATFDRLATALRLASCLDNAASPSTTAWSRHSIYHPTRRPPSPYCASGYRDLGSRLETADSMNSPTRQIIMHTRLNHAIYPLWKTGVWKR